MNNINADRLRLCKVTTDTKETIHSIICGATNFKEGDKVMVALPGAILPGNFKIKKSKLRGVESEGMLCSAKELNIGQIMRHYDFRCINRTGYAY